jgi:putative ABC transport system substrate-binding protein
MRHGAYPALMLADASDQIRRADSPSVAGAVAVLYPEIGEPYRAIFAKIIEGIEDNMKASVRAYAIGAQADAIDLSAQLRRNGVRVVIALGRQGLKAAQGLDKDINVVVGGVLSVQENDTRALAGISLMPDPALLFTRLRSLLPTVKRVVVVYNPQQNESLIRVAREAARNQGLELVAYEARDLASAARLYETSFASADSRRDAIWLPQDTTAVDESTILPLVLKESWNRNIAVFSSSFLHVRKGALFALYPNNLELGRMLAHQAVAIANGDIRRRGISLLREVHTAVNTRTASHIGLNLSYQQQRSFDFIFPEP